jgi:hypothetical protein
MRQFQIKRAKRKGYPPPSSLSLFLSQSDLKRKIISTVNYAKLRDPPTRRFCTSTTDNLHSPFASSATGCAWPQLFEDLIWFPNKCILALCVQICRGQARLESNWLFVRLLQRDLCRPLAPGFFYASFISSVHRRVMRQRRFWHSGQSTALSISIVLLLLQFSSH